MHGNAVSLLNCMLFFSCTMSQIAAQLDDDTVYPGSSLLIDF